MFKRANKITALLVAAASIMSVVPAMAADSTRLGIKEGTIKDAVAFNGKYIFEGYKGDSDKAVYFNDGNKDKELTDYDDYTFTDKTYGDKYLLADDGDDYLVDLTNGSITDDTKQDKLDATASKLEKALKKSDKYANETVGANNLTLLPASAKFAEPWYSFTAAANGATIFTDANGKYIDSSFTANIYAYSTTKGKVVKVSKFDKKYDDVNLEVSIVKPAQVIAQDKDNLYAIVNVDIKDTDSKANTAQVLSTGTVDLSKAVYSATSAKTEGTHEVYEIAYTGTNTVVVGTKTYTAGSDTSADLIAGLKAALTGYDITVEAVTGKILATSKTSGAVAVAPISGTAVSERTPGTADTFGPATFTVAGTTFTYDAASGAGKYKDATDLKNKIIATFAATAPAGYTFDAATLKFTATGDKTKAQVTTDLGTNVTIKEGVAAGAGVKVTNAWYLQKISKAQGTTDEDAYLPKDVTSYQIDNKSLYDNGDVNDAYGWLINGGSVADIKHVQVKDNSLYVYKNDDNNTVKVFKLDLKQIKENPVDKAVFGNDKLDGYVVKKDGDADQDFENAVEDAYDVDVNGVLWVLNDGKIIKFDGKDKTTVYTCDSGFNQLSVYDQNNLVAWSNDDERYTTVTEGSKVTQDEAKVVTPEIKTGWQQDGANWYFNDATGAKVVSKWINVGGAWYYLKADGVMATGWYNDNGTWYFLKSSGAMATGWLNDNGTWYYLNASGAMLANTTVEGYKLGPTGAWVK